MELNMDKKVVENFNAIPSQTKASFTRSFNKTHKDTLIGKKSGGKKGSTTKANAKDDD